MIFRVLILLLLTLRILYSARAAEFEWINHTSENVDATVIDRVANEVIPTFEKEFGKLTQPIKLEYGARPCFRTGFVPRTNSILICEKSGTPNAALDQSDVLAHEMFHAMFCQKRPGDCTEDAFKNVQIGALHEGLAYYFASLWDKDGVFGNETGIARKKYSANFCFSLMPGIHEKGFALAQALIRNKTPLQKVASTFNDPINPFSMVTFFDEKLLKPEPCFEEFRGNASAPQVLAVPKEDVVSLRSKYDLVLGQTMHFQLVANDAARWLFPRLKVQWIIPGDKVEDVIAPSPFNEELKFTMSAIKPGGEKWIAFLTQDDQWLGSTLLYLVVRDPLAKKKKFSASSGKKVP